MRLTRTLPTTLALSLLVAACGGDAEMAETTEAAPEMAAAPAMSSCFLSGATLEEAAARPSPLMETTFSVGGHEGTLCYSAPSANGRVVMGELVPFGEPWRAGANEPTAFHLTGPASIGGVELQAGSYAIYAVPGETEWAFFINSAYERWGIPITDEVRATEVGTFTAPVEANEQMVEQLTYRFVPSEDGTMGDIVLEWEHARVSFPMHAMEG